MIQRYHNCSKCLLPGFTTGSCNNCKKRLHKEREKIKANCNHRKLDPRTTRKKVGEAKVRAPRCSLMATFMWAVTKSHFVIYAILHIQWVIDTDVN